MLLRKLAVATTVSKTERKVKDTWGRWHFQTNHASSDDTAEHCYYNCIPGVVSSPQCKCQLEVLFSSYSRYNFLVTKMLVICGITKAFDILRIFFPLGSKMRSFKQWRYCLLLKIGRSLLKKEWDAFLLMAGKAKLLPMIVFFF